MCNISQGIAENNYNRRVSYGIETGTENTLLASICGLMTTTGWTPQQAMEVLLVPKEQHSALLAKLNL